MLRPEKYTLEQDYNGLRLWTDGSKFYADGDKEKVFEAANLDALKRMIRDEGRRVLDLPGVVFPRYSWSEKAKDFAQIMIYALTTSGRVLYRNSANKQGNAGIGDVRVLDKPDRVTTYTKLLKAREDANAALNDFSEDWLEATKKALKG